MTDNKITIVVDAMGGDGSPYKTLKGTEIFLTDHSNVNIILVGDEKKIIESINSNSLKIFNHQIIHTEENVLNDDTPSTILRNRKNSSIFKGLELIKDKKNFGFISAGNTAALMILSRSILGTIKGIDRPAICSIIPTEKNFSIMLDLGANVIVDPTNLLQFAVMGYCYHSILKKGADPKLGIINIGTENNKGFEFLQEASDMIQKSFLKNYFIGFIEPNKITSGNCDIMVCDGYTGNIILKTAEGMSQFITQNLKKIFNKSLSNKLASVFLKTDLSKFKDEINPEKYNGATLIGVNGVSVKSHGSATPYAFSCAINRCYDFITNDINEKIRLKFEDI